MVPRVERSISAITLLLIAATGSTFTGTLGFSQSYVYSDHLGVILSQINIPDHPDLPAQYSMTETVTQAIKLGSKLASIWIKANSPGQIIVAAQSYDYVKIFNSFQVVELKVCPDYMFTKINGKYNLDPIYNEYYGLVKELLKCPSRTFLISYFFEMNVYMGTSSSRRPDFPTLDFFKRAQAGKNQALKENLNSGVRVYDLVEINEDSNWQAFVKKYFPKMKTDLYSLSHYSLTYPITFYFDFMSKYTTSSPAFGAKNIMLGEFGRTVRNTDETAQSNYLAKVIDDAKSWGVPYLFQFWICDQPDLNLGTSGAGYGLITTKQDGSLRRQSWHMINTLLQGPSQLRVI